MLRTIKHAPNVPNWSYSSCYLWRAMFSLTANGTRMRWTGRERWCLLFSLQWRVCSRTRWERSNTNCMQQHSTVHYLRRLPSPQFIIQLYISEPAAACTVLSDSWCLGDGKITTGHVWGGSCHDWEMGQVKFTSLRAQPRSADRFQPSEKHVENLSRKSPSPGRLRVFWKS